MQTVVGILWFLTRLQLWFGSVVGPLLLIAELVSFVVPIQGCEREFRGRPVETVSDRLLLVGVLLLFSALSLSYTLYFRRRIDRHRFVKYGYILLLVVGPAAASYPTVAAFSCAALIAILWWQEARRIPPGHCRQCRYDLTGNVSGRCPECGTPVAPAPESATTSSALRAEQLLVRHKRKTVWAFGVLCILGVLAALYEWADWPSHISARWLLRLQPVSWKRVTPELRVRFFNGAMRLDEARQFFQSCVEVRASAKRPQSGQDGVTVTISVRYTGPQAYAVDEWTAFVDGEPADGQLRSWNGGTRGFGDRARGSSAAHFVIHGVEPGKHEIRIRATVGQWISCSAATSQPPASPYGWLIDETVEVEVAE